MNRNSTSALTENTLNKLETRPKRKLTLLKTLRNRRYHRDPSKLLRIRNSIFESHRNRLNIPNNIHNSGIRTFLRVFLTTPISRSDVCKENHRYIFVESTYFMLCYYKKVLLLPGHINHSIFH